MTERPILFSAPMVRAILDGRKKQTRQVIKPQPDVSKLSAPWELAQRSATKWGFMQRINFPQYQFFGGDFRPARWTIGDRLWVREAWASVPASAYRCSEGVAQTVNPSDRTEAAIYRSGFDRSYGGIRWRSPIHMPRWASRITLAVTAVRVERLQDISEEDAISEGACDKTDFAEIWQTINAKRAPWETNPWVSVTTFRRTT